jgi:hypothetical protein
MGQYIKTLINRHLLALFHTNIIEIGGYKVKYEI